MTTHYYNHGCQGLGEQKRKIFKKKIQNLKGAETKDQGVKTYQNTREETGLIYTIEIARSPSIKTSVFYSAKALSLYKNIWG